MEDNSQPTPSPMRQVWERHTQDLTEWVQARLVNRTDAYGAYGARGIRTEKTGITDDDLAKHFKGERLVGLHSTSTDETCKWLAFDIDCHVDDAKLAAANEATVKRLFVTLQDQFSFEPLLLDSDGGGSYHVLILFDSPMQLKDVHRFGQRIRTKYEVEDCELFPKQEQLPPKGYGNWLRLFGRHHTQKSHWTRVWNGAAWLSGAEAIDYILKHEGDDGRIACRPSEQSSSTDGSGPGTQRGASDSATKRRELSVLTLRYQVDGANVGDRNDTLFRAACDYAKCGFSVERCLTKLTPRATEDGLTGAEVTNTIRSAYNRPRGLPPTNDGARTEPNASIVAMTTLADVDPEQVEYLWPGKIPTGMLTVIAGDPGLGKSTILLDIACRISAGRPFPDSQDVANPVGDTILMLAEDGHSQVRVRLDNADGDAKRIHILDGMRLPDDDYIRPISLDHDVRVLDRILEDSPDVRLIGVDPLDAFIGADTDAHKKADVVRVLSGLATIAEQHNIAVVGVLHLRKNSSDRAIYRAMGSLGFVSAPRAVWAVSRDKQDRENRLMTCVKFNIGPEPTGLAFTIEDAGLIHWGAEPVTMTADEALSVERPQARTARDDASDWLLEILAVGPMLSNDLKAAAKRDGISWRTLNRAKNELGVRARRHATGWRWELGECHPE